MGSLTSIQFIESALTCDGPLALSYRHADLKWLIRDHLLSLVRNFSSFTPSIDTFTHDDGETVNLLNATGSLQVSSITPPIPLTIWIHQSYPFVPPLVFVMPIPNTPPLVHDHPFVDPSGATSSPYLVTWRYPRSNLLDLVRNLAHLFSLHHPCFPHPMISIFSNLFDPFLASKMEALNYLTIALRHDMVGLLGESEEDIIGLSSLNNELHSRADELETAISLGFEHELSSLKERVIQLTVEADVLTNWLRFNDPKPGIGTAEWKVEDAFETVNKSSTQMLEVSAEDLAIEDLLYALDKAVGEGVIPFDQYIKQVRSLSREQFFHRAKMEKLRKN